jgi:hypothetical protein
MFLQGLNTIAYYAQQFYQEKLARNAQPTVASSGQASRVSVDTGELEHKLEDLVQTGKLDSTLIQELMSLNDESAIDRIIAKLKDWGADEGTSSTLNIADYYRPGMAKYQLMWPLSPTLTLPVSFDQLDRETQFYVLFNEWSRRELEGHQALHAGDTHGAQAIFQECLARAEQLEVAELKARSYEGFVRVAQKLNDRQAERQWLDAALAIREPG